MLRDSAVVLATGWTVFMLCARLAATVVESPAAHQLVLKGLLVAVSFGLIAVSRRSVAGTYGFEPTAGVPWRRTVLTGLALGGAASLLILLLGGSGMQAAVGAMKFWQILLFVWIASTISEEIFTRGWAQGALDRWRGVRFGGYSLPVITAAVLFGSMHATLVSRGVDVLTTVIVVGSATLLGLIAGKLRERHGGLAPAIAVHMSFNVGGAIGGMLYVLGYRAITGKLPTLA